MNTSADRVVDDLVRAHLLDAQVRARAREVVEGALAGPAPAAVAGARALPKLVEVVAYLGGALVLAATGLFAVEQWDALSFGGQVGVLAVAVVALGIAAVVARPDAASHDVRRRLSGSFGVGAAAASWALVAIVADRYLSTDRLDWPTLLGSLAMLVVTAGGYRLAPTALGVLAAGTSLVTPVVVLVDGVDASRVLPDGLTLGSALLVLAGLWLAATEGGVFRGLMVARAVGVSIALWGAQLPVFDGDRSWIGYLLTAGVVVLGAIAYLGRQAWPYLAVAVIGVTLVVPEAVSDWTDGSLGAVGAVLVTGLTLLLASFAGYRLRGETSGRGALT